MINFGPVPIGAVLPVLFDSFAGATGASITISGLAVTDIGIYKGTSMAQRSSVAGYALLDTDGIDIDGITGIQGFSIDTGDNTDAGFYAAGSYYTVVVSAITVDLQTVNFIAATFRCVPAESSAGVPKVDESHHGGSAQTAGDLVALLNTIDDFIDTEIAAIKAKTDNLPAAPAAVGDIPTANQVRDAIFARAYSAAYGSLTFDQLTKLVWAVLFGKASGLGTTIAIYRNMADTADVVTATVDADGNRSAVTLSP